MSDDHRIKVVKVAWNKHSLIETCKITVLVEDNSDKESRLLHKHGLSFLIETTSKNGKAKLLLDTGPSPEAITYNIKSLRVKLDDLDVIAVSHGHYDHTDGILEALKLTSNPIPVIIHPKIFHPKFIYKPNLTYIGSKFDRSSIEEVGDVLVSTDNPVTVANGVLTSGEIPLSTSFEKPKGFWKVEDDKFVEDLMVDEQAVVVNLSKGLVVIVGCAHRGIVNTIRHARRIMNKEKVHALIGGFHLAKASDKIINATMSELEEITPDKICPCHCTGTKAVKKLIEKFGDHCKPIHTGDRIFLR